MQKLTKKEEEAKKIEQVKKIFKGLGSWYTFRKGESSVMMLGSENAFVCVNREVFFLNLPTEDIFKLGEIETGKELGYDDDVMNACYAEGYYFVPTWDKNIDPDAYPSYDVADEIDFLNDSYAGVDTGEVGDAAWDAFQKEVAELKKEQEEE